MHSTATTGRLLAVGDILAFEYELVVEGEEVLRRDLRLLELLAVDRDLADRQAHRVGVPDLLDEAGATAALEGRKKVGVREIDAVLLMVGEGPERSSAQALARRLGVLDRIRFLGTRRGIAEIAGMADVFLARDLLLDRQVEKVTHHKIADLQSALERQNDRSRAGRVATSGSRPGHWPSLGGR